MLHGAQTLAGVLCAHVCACTCVRGCTSVRVRVRVDIHACVRASACCSFSKSLLLSGSGWSMCVGIMTYPYPFGYVRQFYLFKTDFSPGTFELIKLQNINHEYRVNCLRFINFI